MSNAERLRHVSKEEEMLYEIKRQKPQFFGCVMRNKKYHFLQVIMEVEIQIRQLEENISQ